jgi:calcineurin-like phosphoesterase family protein
VKSDSAGKDPGPWGVAPEGRIRCALPAAALIVSAVFLAFCAPQARAESKVRLAPASGAAGMRVTVVGTDFGRRDRVRVRAGGKVVAKARTSRHGRFRASFSVPRGTGDSVRIVSRSRGRRIANRFQVSDVSNVAEIASRGGRRVRWTPIEAAAGSVVRMEGSGFRARRLVRIRVGPVPVATARADLEGRFSTALTVPSLAAGRRFLRVRSRHRALGFFFRILSAGDQAGDGSAGAKAGRAGVPGLANVSADTTAVIAAAGDIACSTSASGYNGGKGTADKCRQKYTSDLLVNAGLAAVLPLGDTQYESASLSQLTKSYNPTWGRVKSITRPAAGNHEYKTSGAAGYFDYFNGAGVATGPAGDRGKGYYSFNVGAWHLIALNSTDHCTIVSCKPGSAQEAWLRADLAANAGRYCTLAFWHDPRFNSGHDGNADEMAPLFQDLYNANADVVLGGHAHDYERFAPQNPSGKLDTARGIRQFVVGTGGAFFTAMGTPKPNSQVRQSSTYGVLKLTLRPTSYDWQFVPEAGKSFRDSGSQACH